MKSKIKQNEQLAGNVKITVYKNGKKVNTIVKHNNSTSELRRYIIDALAGDYVIAKRPNNIVPCRKDDKKLIKMFSGGIPSTSDILIEEDEANNTASLTLHFIIPSSIISSNTRIGGFELLSNDSELTTYASLMLNDGDEILTDGSNINIEVDWKLIIKS